MSSDQGSILAEISKKMFFSLVKTVFQNAFLKSYHNLKYQLSTIFYALGYDMVRCFNEDSVRGIAKTIYAEIDDLLDVIGNNSSEPIAKKERSEMITEATKKSLVFITIPEVH